MRFVLSIFYEYIAFNIDFNFFLIEKYEDCVVVTVFRRTLGLLMFGDNSTILVLISQSHVEARLLSLRSHVYLF